MSRRSPTISRHVAGAGLNPLKVTNEVALAALAVGRTRTGGDVRQKIQDVLNEPAGGWGRTVQAEEQAENAVACAADCAMRRHVTNSEAIEATNALIDAALDAGWPCHPNRRD